MLLSYGKTGIGIGVGDGLVVIGDLGDAVQAVIAVLRHLAPGVGAGREYTLIIMLICME